MRVSRWWRSWIGCWVSRRRLDAAVGSIKTRRRGVSAGELVLSMAGAQMTGADFLVGMDHRRADTAGQRERDKPWEATRLGPAGRGCGRRTIGRARGRVGGEVGVPASVVVGEGVVEYP